MNKEILSKYRIRVIRINKLNSEIDELQATEVEMVAGKVKTSMADFPYIQCRTSVMMDDPVEKGKITARVKKKQVEIDKLQKINDEVDQFIDAIEEPLAKSIFEYYFIDGLVKVTQKEVAANLGIDDRSKVSRVIESYL